MDFFQWFIENPIKSIATLATIVLLGCMVCRFFTPSYRYFKRKGRHLEEYDPGQEDSE